MKPKKTWLSLKMRSALEGHSWVGQCPWPLLLFVLLAVWTSICGAGTDPQTGTVTLDVIEHQYSINGELVDKVESLEDPESYLPSQATRVVVPGDVQIGELPKIGPVISLIGLDLHYSDDGELKQVRFGDDQ